ncbi:uncharacterized protein LOC131935561 isoform X2 [Physella acuta]|uniref:uncharacterized protein LOC131935561 isoform X2 n=1 Tax=Physella acuta TaxID=109671 RepID=UPI0027DD163C|nr:uncharacterized protein LOC131935561 isoform X2 [Physella acuta]
MSRMTTTVFIKLLCLCVAASGCVNVTCPGYGQPCVDVCASNFLCQDVSGVMTCQCGPSQLYNTSTEQCENTTYLCLSTGQPSCQNLPDGDYPACPPECSLGIYLSCSFDSLTLRDCPFGWYVNASGQRFTSKLVYDPDLQRCEPRSPSCPRDLDQQIEI